MSHNRNIRPSGIAVAYIEDAATPDPSALMGRSNLVEDFTSDRSTGLLEATTFISDAATISPEATRAVIEKVVGDLYNSGLLGSRVQAS